MSLQIAIKKTAPPVRRDELKFIQRLIAGDTAQDAAMYTGVNKARSGHVAGKWRRDARIQARLIYELRAKVLTSDLTRARVTILKLMEDTAVSPAVRLRAAQTVQEYAQQFMAADLKDADGKDLNDMSEAELQARIEALERTLQGGETIQGEAVDVTPESGHGVPGGVAKSAKLLNMLE